MYMYMYIHIYTYIYIYIYVDHEPKLSPPRVRRANGRGRRPRPLLRWAHRRRAAGQVPGGISARRGRDGVG